MKIDYYHSAPIPSARANSVNVIRTCDAFKAEGCDITLFAARGNGTDEDITCNYGVKFKFPIHRIYVSETRFVGSTKFRSFAFYNILRRDAFVFTRDISVAWIAGLLGRPFAYEMHVLPRRKAQQWMLKQVVNSPALKRFISISKAIQAQLMEEVGKRDDPRFVVIPLGADVDSAGPPVVENDSGQKVVGYVGHLYPGKGEEIIAGLAERFLEVRFEVVGLAGGLAEKNFSNVRLHGVVSHVDAMKHLRGFSIAVAPYQRGAKDFAGVDISNSFSPLKLFEYMAAGKAVVCSDLPVLREILTNGQNAILVPPANLEAWAEAVRKLVEDGELRRTLGQNAYETVSRNYSYRVRAQRLIKEFYAE